MKNTKITIEFLTPFGHKVTVPTTVADYWKTLLEYGRKRWTPANVPVHGIKMPLENYEDFPWEIIGATPPQTFKNDRGEEETVVYFQGQRYVKRSAEENKRKNLPKAIWFSRGVREVDPPFAGEPEYLRLITFSGPGRYKFPTFERPAQSNTAPASASLENRYEAAKAAITKHADTLSPEEKADLRKQLRDQGLTTPPQPLTLEFVEKYEAFVHNSVSQGERG